MKQAVVSINAGNQTCGLLGHRPYYSPLGHRGSNYSVERHKQQQKINPTFCNLHSCTSTLSAFNASERGMQPGVSHVTGRPNYAPPLSPLPPAHSTLEYRRGSPQLCSQMRLFHRQKWRQFQVSGPLASHERRETGTRLGCVKLTARHLWR